ncbi:hypothetical protein IQ249_14450 [Lusitaniella coriacea LEGE 07157]|uniref:Uncharacterized protein n=1 Tax=Lusitaniella coriacea LEGE 07157 TaxID=945747 RepID=A0A8J7DXE9_9CYAN|nr:hypothetical protein [Lusitaniella coriacea]MBE9117099.1 hypothetical protein [Lusitaniella coriacea LEGE 07157]
MSNIVYCFIDVISIGAIAYFFNVAIKKISFFKGWQKTIFYLGEVPILLGVIPVGAGVDFYSYQEFVVDIEVYDRSSRLQKRLLEDLHPLQRITICLSGSFAVFFVAAIVLNPLQASLLTLKGFEQVIRGSLDSEYAMALLKAAENTINDREFSQIFAIFLTKFLALNLLPLASFHGGFVIREIFYLLPIRTSNVSQGFMIVSICISFAIAFRWIMMLIAYSIPSTWL